MILFFLIFSDLCVGTNVPDHCPLKKKKYKNKIEWMNVYIKIFFSTCHTSYPLVYQF